MPSYSPHNENASITSSPVVHVARTAEGEGVFSDGVGDGVGNGVGGVGDGVGGVGDGVGFGVGGGRGTSTYSHHEDPPLKSLQCSLSPRT